MSVRGITFTVEDCLRATAFQRSRLAMLSLALGRVRA